MDFIEYVFSSDGPDGEDKKELARYTKDLKAGLLDGLSEYSITVSFGNAITSPSKEFKIFSNNIPSVYWRWIEITLDFPGMTFFNLVKKGKKDS